MFRLTDTAFLTDPRPLLAQLAEEPALARARIPILGDVWLAHGDGTVRRVLKDTDTFVRNSANANGKSLARQFWWMPRMLRPLLRNVSQSDGDDHKRLRALVSAAFARAAIEDLRPRLRHLAEECLDRLPDNGTVDLVAGFTRPLPTQAICEMLGLPPEDRARIERLVDPLGQVTGIASFFRALPGLWRLLRYFRALFQTARLAPRPGLVQELIAAEDEGDRLSEDELLAMVVALFVAGQETTTALLGHAIVALAEDTTLARDLAEAPDRIPLFVEEIMRLESPVYFTNTLFVARDTEVEGITLRRGDRVVPLLIAANRDPARVTEGDRLIPDRRPNPHLAFGHGPHVCLGMQLARIEAHEAIAAVLARWPKLTLARPAATLPRTRRLGLRGYASLPIRQDA